MLKMIIKNGYIIDPLNKREGVFDILISGSKIKKVAKNIQEKGEEIIDAKNKIVAPGLIDMHVHLREPGREDIETVARGTRAAISGGITSVCSMPNTLPPIDDAKIVKHLNNIIKKEALANVFVVGAITSGRSGRKLVDMANMKKEGAIALSDDGSSVQDEHVMFEAVKKAKENDILLISHCENKNISKNGVVNEGMIATKLGLRGIPKRAEYEFIERDINLAKKAKTKIHIAHVSCKESVNIIRKAKKDGINITTESAPHYFSLDESACVTYDTRTKMNPPLRSVEDIEAIKEGLKDGTLDAIASDHAPHGKHEKEIEFDFAAFGIIGLETSLSLAIMNLIDGKKIPWKKLIELMSTNPAGILGLKQKGNLSEESDADIVIIDPEKKWTYTKDSILSKSKNSPFIGWTLKGLATDAVVGGKIVMKNRKII
ncbi:MAG: dihydroorotase [Candidatus Omnitrophica bacterium]|nr:dihydroorotase [Candidatus Omnitrophota bacterium]